MNSITNEPNIRSSERGTTQPKSYSDTQSVKKIKMEENKENESSDDEEYVVEKIVDKKFDTDGTVLYRIKWKNWNSKDNTWEPSAHLTHCPQMVADFEREWALKEKEKLNKETKGKYGFARGLVPEKILGATDTGGTLKFLMKWKGKEETDVVLAKDANEKCPQIVISFYESMITWHSE